MVQVSLCNIIVTSVCLALFACATGDSENSMAAADATVCEAIRPQVCTMDYRPVCARREDGSTGTYSNGCSACADIKVTSWIADACPE